MFEEKLFLLVSWPNYIEFYLWFMSFGRNSSKMFDFVIFVIVWTLKEIIITVIQVSRVCYAKKTMMVIGLNVTV